MKIMKIAATAVLATALVAGGSIAASAATTDNAPTAADCNFGARLVALATHIPEHAAAHPARRAAVWAHMPVELKRAVTDLRKADPAARDKLASDIADTALAGGYGDKAKAKAERLETRLCK